MAKQHFTHIRAWVFDLDNTLYPPSARLFDQIEVRMTDWVMDALKVVRRVLETAASGAEMALSVDVTVLKRRPVTNVGYEP